MSRKKDKPRKSAAGSQAVTRRDFLRGAGVAVSGGILAGQTGTATPPPEAGAKVLGPGPVPIALRINGKLRKLNLEPRVTLLDTLRNYLDLTGAKKVCDRAVCGSCTVLLDGKPVYACSVLAIEAQGKDVMTIEGFSKGHRLHPVMSAFVENDAQQCGFCTPGFVMATIAFLHKNPNPSLEEACKGLGGNLCRCGTYVGIKQAVLDAAKEMKGGSAHGEV